MVYFDKQFSLPTGYRFLLRDVIKFLTEINLLAKSKNEKPMLLDIGCGNKPYKKLLTNYNYVGMDYYLQVSKPDIIGSITKIPLKNETVDNVMTVWVLDDIPEPCNAIKEISRVLKANGYYFAVEAQSTSQHFKPHDYFRFAPNALIHLCKKNNLKLISYKSYSGDFALVGFSIISILRKIFSKMKINFIMEPFYCFIINIVFAPLDCLFRRYFQDNSIGYCYIFMKVKAK